jgi:hypothetical protein
VKTRPPVRRASLLAPLCIILALVGCEPFDPCPETKDKQERAGQLDVFWNLERISVSKVASASFSLPFPPKALESIIPIPVPVLVNGDLRFLTQFAEKGSSCTELVKTSGTVTANYTFTKDGKTVRDWQIGVFDYDHKSGSITLRAYGYKIPGTVTRDGDNFDMRFSIEPGKFKKEYEPLGTLFLRFTKSPF